MRWGRTFLLLLLSLWGGLACATPKNITLTTSVWEPYIMPTGSNQAGYAYDVVKAAFMEMGYSVDIQEIPWDEALKKTYKGTVDALFPEYYSKKATRYVAFSHSFLAGPLVLYKRIHDPIVLPQYEPFLAHLSQVFEALKQYRFGVVAGYTNVPAFDKNHALTKIAVVDDQANLKQLYEGKVDLIIIDKLNAQYILRHMLPPQYGKALVPLPRSIGQINLHVAFSKKAPNYQTKLHDFNEGIRRLQARFATRDLMRKYIYEFIDQDLAPQRLNASP